MSKSGISCYYPQKGTDDVIAAKVPGWNSYTVAVLRGLYREKHNNTDTVDVEELKNFRKNLTYKEARDFTDAITNPIAAYGQLKEAFTAQERIDRPNMLAQLFSRVVDGILEANPEIDRMDLIRGFRDSEGNFTGGPAFIYNEVRKELTKQMLEAARKGDKDTVQKYQNVFRNWGALVTYANTLIRENEGIVIGTNLTFASEADFSNYDDNSMMETFVMEESTRERYQEVAESISPLGRMSVSVRRMLGRLYDYKTDDESAYDDLGYIRNLPVTSVHQALIEMLRGMQSESDMINILREKAKDFPYINQILNEFDRNPILRTQFFVDMNKTLQPYSMMVTTKKGNLFSVKHKNLSQLTRERAFGRYASSVLTGSAVSGHTIFRYENGNAVVNRGEVDALVDLIESTLGTGREENLTVYGTYSDDRFEESLASFSKNDRINFYRGVFVRLGINLSDREYSSLVENNTTVRKINDVIRDLPKVLKGKYAEDAKSFKELLYAEIGKNAEGGFLKEKLGKIMQITEGLDNIKKFLARTRYRGNTYFSDVQSSYLGRFKDAVQRLSKRGDKKTIQAWINARFPEGTYDKKGLYFYNRWLRDMYSSNPKQLASLINTFDLTKMLGDDIQKVEDFIARKDALSMITKYFSENQKYAWYPVFILGDSNAVKYLKAPRYKEADIVNGLYDMYLQEKLFQRRLKEFRNYLKNNNKALGSFEKMDTDRFGLLPFLNNVALDNDVTEQSVKEAIRKHLDESFKVFMSNLNKEGVLDIDAKGKYIYLNSLAKNKSEQEGGGDNVRKALYDYFINTKFATVQQINLMTVNPVFYMNTTDLQKRYKEIHASGNTISVEAIDPFRGDGKRFCERDYQTTVYINDIKVNTEETNSEFMDVIKAVYGENSDIYKDYSKVSLTDGQAWRTLKSYRAVMGMAGKWTDRKLEDAYNEIEAIRKEIRETTGEANETQMKRLSELAVVFQPIKPFLYTLENVSLRDPKTGQSVNFLLPVQIKYAEITVIPEMLPKNSKLRKIMEWAEQNDTDLVAATTAVKVGNYGAADVQSGKNSREVEDALGNAIIHKLSYKDFVIQTNIPESVQGSHLYATQGRKITMSELAEVDENGVTIDYSHYTDGNRVNLGGSEKVKMNAYNLNRFYVSLIAANILEDLDKFSSVIEDPEKVRKALVQMTVNNSRESKDNLRGYSQGMTMEDMFLMPLFEGGIEHDTAALLLSMFKKQVNKQKINGGSAVQASAFGIRDYEEKDNLKFVKDPDADNILYAECEIPWDLYYTDAAGNRVELQFSDWCNPDGSLKLGKVIDKSHPEYKDYLSFKVGEGKYAIPLIEERFPGILSFIALRIPTEEKYSMLNVKVTSFTLKSNGGGTIKVPAQGTRIAGFDFDADKLYFMRREYRYKTDLDDSQIADIWNKIYEENPEIKARLKAARAKDESLQDSIGKLFSSFYHSTLAQEIADTEGVRDRLYKYWEEAGLEGTPEQVFNDFLEKHAGEYLELDKYDYDRTPWDQNQSRVARNNMLINIVQRRLEDPQTIRERTTPGGFKDIENAAVLMKELLGIHDESYDYSDPWTIVMYNQQNRVAEKLVGIFANQNINNAISSLMSEFSLRNPIAFGHHREGLSNLINRNAQTKQLLASAVDAVKNPVLQFFNINTVTASSAALLSRIGYSFEEIGVLFNQPIIRDLCNESMSNGIFNIDTALNNVLQDWGYDASQILPEFLDFDTLAKSVKDYTKDNSLKNDARYRKLQIQVAFLFKDIYQNAKEVDQFVTNTKFTASNAVKSTFGGMYAQQDKVRRYINSFGTKEEPLLILKVADNVDAPLRTDLDTSNRDEYMREVMNNPFGYEQAMYDANVSAINRLCKYFPYNNATYKSSRSFMTDLTEAGLDEDTINQIHEHMLRFMAGRVIEDSIFNPDYNITLDDGSEVRAEDFYKYYVPVKIEKYIADNREVRSLPIFSLMVFETDKDGNIIMKLGDTGALTDRQKEDVRDSWEILLDSADPVHRKIAFDLYMYSYYHSGFGFGVIGFNHLSPLELKLQLALNSETSYRQFLRYVQNDSIKVNNVEFAQDFIKTHRNNTRLVYAPRSKQAKYLNNKIYDSEGGLNSTFTLDYSDLKERDNIKPFVLRTTKESVHFKPAILVNNALYIADGERFNRSSNGKMTYRLADDRKKVDINEVLDNSTLVVEDDIPRGIDKWENDALIKEIARVSAENNHMKSAEIGEEGIISNYNNFITESLREKKFTEDQIRQSLINELTGLYKQYGATCKSNGKKIC